MFMTERMFIIIGNFLFGYCLGYYSFDIFKYKNQKHEIDDFFSSYNKKYGMQHRILTKKMEEIKITDDIFLGNDLFYEENFLNNVIEKFGKEIKDCEVSFYLRKKSMSICCETLTMTETIAKKLLKIVDRLMDEYFFQTNGLRQLGWCAHYMFDRRSLNYTEDKKEILRRTEVTEFY